MHDSRKKRNNIHISGLVLASYWCTGPIISQLTNEDGPERRPSRRPSKERATRRLAQPTTAEARHRRKEHALRPSHDDTGDQEAPQDPLLRAGEDVDDDRVEEGHRRPHEAAPNEDDFCSDPVAEQTADNLKKKTKGKRKEKELEKEKRKQTFGIQICKAVPDVQNYTLLLDYG